MKGLFRSARFLRPFAWQFVGALASLLVSTAAGLFIPQMTQRLVDVGIGSGNMILVIGMALTMVLLALGRSLFTFFQGALSAQVAHGFAYDLRNAIYEKIQSLSFSYHDKAQTGQLMTRATSDVDQVQGFIGQGLLMIIGAVATMLGSLTMLFVTDWQLSLVMLGIMVLTFALFGSLTARTQPLFKVAQARLAHLNTVLQENLAGVRVVKAFVREAYESQRYADANKELYDINIRIGRLFALLMPLVFFIANLALLSVYWIGGGQVIGGRLSLGRMLAFANYMMMAFFPTLMLTFILTMVAQAGASAERIFEVLDARSDVLNRDGAGELPSVEGRVVFENVSFGYFGGERVLDRVSFEAQPGQVIALLGATGSGKSTIINLIPRFYDVSEGRVLVDGVDVRDVTIESLRRQIGIVFQEVTLFSGTIRENVAFGRPEATMDEIEAAARAAEAHDFIAAFPNSYETMVGERGVTLSGGQKQRIAIARALLTNPRILILDDSTSSVDLETEYRIQKALGRLMEGRTSFVIAQRIATVLNADQILVLDKGQLAAHGTHEMLIRESELYADIYYSQLQPDAAAQNRAAAQSGVAVSAETTCAGVAARVSKEAH